MGLWDVIQHPRLRMRLLIMVYVWFVVSLVSSNLTHSAHCCKPFAACLPVCLCIVVYVWFVVSLVSCIPDPSENFSKPCTAVVACAPSDAAQCCRRCHADECCSHM